jgi:hypothetical protein
MQLGSLMATSTQISSQASQQQKGSFAQIASMHGATASTAASGPPGVHGLCAVGGLHSALHTPPMQGLSSQQSALLMQRFVEHFPTQTLFVQAPAQQSVSTAQEFPADEQATAQKKEEVDLSQWPLQHWTSSAQSTSSSEQARAAQWPSSVPGAWTQCVSGQQSVSIAQASPSPPHVGGSAQRFTAGSQKLLQQSWSTTQSNLLSLQTVVAHLVPLQILVQQSTSRAHR